MPAAPVEDRPAEMSERGTAPAAEATSHPELKPTSGAGDSESQAVKDGKTDGAIDTTNENNKRPAGEPAVDRAAKESKKEEKAVDDKEDGKDGDDKDEKKSEVKELTAEEKEKYAIHSELQQKLSAEIEKKPQSEWGVTNAAREDDEPAAEGGKPGEEKVTPTAPKSGMPDDKSSTPADQKEGIGAKVKHMLHHDKK